MENYRTLAHQKTQSLRGKRIKRFWESTLTFTGISLVFFFPAVWVLLLYIGSWFPKVGIYAHQAFMVYAAGTMAMYAIALWWQDESYFSLLSQKIFMFWGFCLYAPSFISIYLLNSPHRNAWGGFLWSRDAKRILADPSLMTNYMDSFGSPWVWGPFYVAMAIYFITWPFAWWHQRQFFKWYGQTKKVSRGPEQESTNIRFYAEPSRHNFTKVVGMDELKTRLKQAGEEIVASMPQEDGNGYQPPVSDNPRNGILLFGEPGNGKTYFAESLAGELGLPMISFTYGDAASKWVNQTTETVVQVFKDAAAQAPCVLFLDEVDSLLIDRSSAIQSDAEGNKTVNTLLTEMVNLRSKGVVLIAATNYLDKLDSAAIREGRFDYKIEVPTPDEPARKSILHTFFKTKGQGVAIDAGAVDRAATRWVGYSVSRLRAVAEEAARTAKASGDTLVGFDDMMAALRRIQGRKGRLPEDTMGLDQLVLSNAQRQVLTSIATRMHRIEEVEKMGGTVPAGLLFSGPPGTGKTATARALAKASDWAFLETSGNDLLRDPDKIDKLLKEARDIRPAIVFIDEADDILADRQGYNNVSVTVTNKLLTAMDGASGKTPDIVFIAATNHPENIDAAALRGGRFTEKVEFELPAKSEVQIMVSEWLAKTRAKVSSDFTPEVVADMLHGHSNANIRAIMQTAVNIAVGRNLSNGVDHPVGLADVLAARRTVGGESA